MNDIISYWLQFLLVFVSVGCADVCWAMYFLKISQQRSIPAGIWGGLVTLLSAFTVTEYVHDHSLIVAAVLGGMVGTYSTVEYHKRKKWKDK